MQSFEYIESGVLFNLVDPINFKNFRYTGKDFAKHGEVHTFIINYVDQYKETPSISTLSENYPTLDTSAQTLNYDYAVDQFKDQVVYRKIVNSIQSQKELLKDNPSKALSSIISTLGDVEIETDEDVSIYNDGTPARLEEWKERTKRRQMGDGLMGIPTPFTSFNNTGVGWMPGELIAMFARPTVGKTWMCVEAAATAVMNGYKTLLISTEMTTSAISLRADVVLAKKMGYNFSHRALRNGDPIDEEQYMRFLKELNGRSLLVCDHIEGEATISIESIARLVRKHSPDFVVLDGIYLISSGDGKKAMWEQSHALFYGMKNLCISTNTAIWVSTQATREAANMFEPPRADQVAFGDALIRAADVAMAMCLIEDHDDKRLMQIQKYRDGVLPAEEYYLHWDVDCGMIYEDDEFSIVNDDDLDDGGF
jgi:replicative DNA helicase